MPDKPSYLGLLNAIALAESEAECYLNAWADATPNPAVRQVISTVALREGEHGKAFAKRICELGYTLRPKEGGNGAAKMDIAASRDLSDREKFEKLDVGQQREADEGDDIFTSMFRDKSIDIQTGALLGRYIAEERDSGRMLRACYSELCAAENGGASASSSAQLSAQLGRIEELLEKLVAKSLRK
jgi:hypothetical protein